MLGLKALPELPSDNTTIEPDAPAALMDDIHLPDEAALDGTPDAFRRAFAGAQEQRAKMADGGGREIQLVGPNVFKAARYLLRNELIIKGRHNRATRALPLVSARCADLPWHMFRHVLAVVRKASPRLR